MPITIHTAEQIAQMRAAGRLVAQTLDLLRSHVRPGVILQDLDRVAEQFIRSQGAIPAYKGYPNAHSPFPATICVAPNEVVCHGIPDRRRLEEGDIVGIDVGVRLNGWYGDSCVTLPVGAISPEAQHLLEVTEESMWRGIRAVQSGAHLGDIGAAIQRYAESHACSVVREWAGHGIGQRLHDEPSVPHYGRAGMGVELRRGMIFTIEPMVNLGRPETVTDEGDGWTVRTVDGSLSAQFEHTLAITEHGVEIMSIR